MTACKLLTFRLSEAFKLFKWSLVSHHYQLFIVIVFLITEIIGDKYFSPKLEPPINC